MSENEQSGYIHGTTAEEQGRLARLNALTNPPFLEFLELAPDARVLEIGSGLGILANEVALRVPQGVVYGIEYAPEQLAQAQATASNLHLMRGDARRLPFADSSFDLVYCRYVLEHVGDPLQALREAYRVLRPGGSFRTQENNWRMVEFDPDCPATEALLPQFIALQAQLGGDALLGKRLFGLLRQVGFHPVTLSFQPEIHTADTPHFRLWVENAREIFEGASAELQARRLVSASELAVALAELNALLANPYASALFHWNRAIGIK